jgi:cytochrome c oxidase subunit II
MDQESTRAAQALPRSRLRQRAWRRRVPSSLILWLCAPLGACQGVQSALDPAADEAARLATLSIVLFSGGAVIFFGVTALLIYAVFAPPASRHWLGQRRTIVAGGLIFPIVTLTAVLTYGLVDLRLTNAAESGGRLRIEVVGEQYWWRVRYLSDGANGDAFATANEIQVPLGRPVELLVTAADVIHAIWIPNFAGKIDMIPGRVNRLTFTAARPGVYRGQCTEFCGDQHARMAFDVVALDPAAFEAWRGRQAQPASEPATAFLEKGRTLFIRNGCGNCHAVRGTQATGALGPDLTHVGSRRSIGAGQFPNNVGTLAGWISDTQHLKGGARMPSYGSLAGEDLRAVAGYLASLQ